MRRRSGCKEPIMGKKGRGVLIWATGKYSVKQRNPDSKFAYRQQGIGRITALPQRFCDEETFISLIDQIYDSVTLVQADGYISMDFFEMDIDGNLIVNENEDYFELDSETGELVNLRC